VPRSPWKIPLFALLVVCSNALGNFALAWGMRHLQQPASTPLTILRAIFTPWVAVGIILLILWLLSRMAFLSFADLSYILPVTSVGYVASVVLGLLFLGERVTPARWIGAFLISIGAILAGSGQSGTGVHPDEESVEEPSR